MSESESRLPAGYASLLTEVKQRVGAARYAALKAVNKELVGLYWGIGRMIVGTAKESSLGKVGIGWQLPKELEGKLPSLQGIARLLDIVE